MDTGVTMLALPVSIDSAVITRDGFIVTTAANRDGREETPMVPPGSRLGARAFAGASFVPTWRGERIAAPSFSLT